MKKPWIFLLTLFLLLPLGAQALESTSYTFSYDAVGTQLRIVQDAYQSLCVFQGFSLKSPQDMTVEDGMMYIADTGNKRVLRVDLSTGEVLVIKGKFGQPTSVATDAQGRIYVADYQKSTVFRYNAQGELEMEYAKPDSPAYGVNNVFKPKSVAPIGDGGIYVVADGSANGIVQLNANGEFVGFFASNTTRTPLIYKLYDLILTDEQMLKYSIGTPQNYSSIMMGTDGLVYALSNGSAVSLQKLSYTGVNLFRNSRNRAVLIDPVDMDMTKDGSFFILHKDGYVSQLTQDGVLLYRFGGAILDVAREGLLQTPAGIGVDDDGHVYVLDKATGQVHVYAPTDSQKLTAAAINHYYAGEYEKSRELLDQILKFNSNSYYARLYRGKTYMHMQNYEAAAEQFLLAKAKVEYSDAWWEIRNNFLWQNGLYLLLAVIALAVFFLLYRHFRPSSRGEYNSYAESVQLRSQFTGLRPHYLKRAMFHPIDTAYEIKRRHMGGYAAAFLLFGGLVLAMSCREIFAGFLFSQDTETFPVVYYALGIIAVILLFVFSNYFITSISDGEGTLSMIASVSAYAMLPLIFGSVILTVVCNVLTLQESLIVNTLTVFLYTYSFVNLSCMLMELHNYTFRQYVKSLILTLLFMILCVLVLSLLYLMVKQGVDFVIRVLMEVALRE